MFLTFFCPSFACPFLVFQGLLYNCQPWLILALFYSDGTLTTSECLQEISKFMFFFSSGIYLTSRSMSRLNRSAFLPSTTHVPCPCHHFWHLAYSSNLCLFQHTGAHQFILNNDWQIPRPNPSYIVTSEPCPFADPSWVHSYAFSCFSTLLTLLWLFLLVIYG